VHIRSTVYTDPLSWILRQLIKYPYWPQNLLSVTSLQPMLPSVVPFQSRLFSNIRVIRILGLIISYTKYMAYMQLSVLRVSFMLLSFSFCLSPLSHISLLSFTFHFTNRHVYCEQFETSTLLFHVIGASVNDFSCEYARFLCLWNLYHRLDLGTAKTKLNSMAWFRERTIPTEWPPLVGEVSANFWG
jgi:hypothetical protein